MIYKGEKTKNISFPLGGIGTGSIGLAGNGELVDWEIFNRPAKNTRNGYTHFALKATVGEKSEVRVLHSDTKQNLIGIHLEGHHNGIGFGPHAGTMAGYPHFKEAEFDATFPIAKMEFSEEGFPAVAKLCAFNPFIPHDAKNSSLPVAFFEWEIENTASEGGEFTLAFSVRNPSEVSENKILDDGRGLFLYSAQKDKEDIEYLDLCAMTDAEDVCVQEYWYRGMWKDGPTTYWKNLAECKRMPVRHYDEAGKLDNGTVTASVFLNPKEKKTVRFVLAWNKPNQYNYWREYKDENGKDITWKNYYATVFENSEATARYALENFSDLLDKTRKFADALKRSTLPDFVTDAVTANLSVLKSPTVLRLDDGSFWGWEGVTETDGSCEGTCQHVWNYAYAMPYLFPELERTLRENTLKYALRPSGESNFRIALPRGREPFNFRACLDGQMGEVIKWYREWKISGDTDWLRENADKVFSMLEFAWSEENPDKWDYDFDGVLEGRQHHTLDMELYGPSSWLEGFYLLALDCGAKMAEALGDGERAEKYRGLYEKGRKWTNENLFSGEYFYQRVNLGDKAVVDSFDAAEDYWNEEAKEIKYQVADGCIIDQMLSDFHAHLIGLDGIFDKDKKATALESLYKYNFKPSMREVTNMWRIFALNDEAGTVICSYPDGVKVPAIPIPYCEETMTGFEYALAALMIAEGKVEKGETIVKAIRDRYDGEKRNPWNEIECGSNYARSMASFALLPIYAGFSYDMTDGYIGFKPIFGGGEFFFSVKDSFGTMALDGEKIVVTVLGNPLTLRSFGTDKTPVALFVDGANMDFEYKNGRVIFKEATVKERLEIKIS